MKITGTATELRLAPFTERIRMLKGRDSYKEFAERLGISRQSLGFYINGARLPDVVTLLQIANRCGVTTDWLLGKTDTKNSLEKDWQYEADATGSSVQKPNRSFEMGRRLKALRNAKGLSHNDLKNEFQSRYGIKISRASLLNYEIDNEFHSKADALSNLKMNAEYLNCFADFYGVSTDYLLCKTDISALDEDVQCVCNCTGISENGVSILKRLERQDPAFIKSFGDVSEAVLFSMLKQNGYKSGG